MDLAAAWHSMPINVILGYIISWAYFFIALPLSQALFGKVKGTSINYGVSWVVWILATHLITLLHSKNNTTSLGNLND